MNKSLKNFVKVYMALGVILASGVASATTAQNSRSATTPANGATVSRPADTRTVSRTSHTAKSETAEENNNRSVATARRAATVGTASRSAVSPASRSATTNARTAKKVINIKDSAPARGVSVSRAGATPLTLSNVMRSIARSARGATTARAGMTPVTNVSRAGKARATAVFNDISKIGGGYAQCREAYATCMDQFCANANDTYRRCYCSSRFTEFRDAEEAIDEAKTLIAKFEDNNLNAVDKSAEEVNAMYSATVGEAAIKNDTSGAQAMLSEIGDLLSGKKKSTKNTISVSGLLDVDFSSGMDDIWSGTGGGGIFATNNTVDASQLEGIELYNSVHKQCVGLVASLCENDAVLNMAKSAYNIMITQDCNLYENKVNSKKETVKQAVRQAEKYLREARLDDYRAHNSKDVNDCIDKVKVAVTNETACGENYRRCLDPTGAYINQTTGDAIYSPRLFKLNELIVLDGRGGDVLRQNDSFNKFLDGYKARAATALDSCRSVSDLVWEEFKRTALIEIAQAQDEKIEEVKMSCVATMKECYDTNSAELKKMDDTKAQASGAVAAYATREMCKDKVLACATLWGDGKQDCTFDGNGKLVRKGNNCGMDALLAFVGTVDDVRISEGCETSVENYIKKLCTPTSGDQAYPWQCRTMDYNTLRANIQRYAYNTCGAGGAGLQSNSYSATYNSTNGSNPQNIGGTRAASAVRARVIAPTMAVSTASSQVSSALVQDLGTTGLTKYNYQRNDTTYDDAGFKQLTAQIQESVNRMIDILTQELEFQLQEACESLDGYWRTAEAVFATDADPLAAFYSTVYGSRDKSGDLGYGICLENTTMLQCLSYNSDDNQVAKYDKQKDICEFTDDWYKNKCGDIGGYWENAICYIPHNNSADIGKMQSAIHHTTI